MAVKATAEIELLVTLDADRFRDLEDRIRARGTTRSEQLELTRDISARVESSAFHISPSQPVSQKVRSGRDARWVWIIEPKEAGRHTLLLTITATGSDGQVIEPLTRTIDVTAVPVPLTASAVSFLLANWKEVLTVVLLPAAAWAWRRYDRRRASAAAPPLPPIAPPGSPGVD